MFHRPVRRASRSSARAAPRPKGAGIEEAARLESISPRGGPAGARRACRARAHSSHSLQPGAARASASVRQDEPKQRVVKLLGVDGIGPGLGLNLGDRLGVEPAKVGRALRVAPAPGHDGLRPPLFKRRVVEEGVGSGRQRLQARAAKARSDRSRQAQSRLPQDAAAAAPVPRCPSPHAGSRRSPDW